MQSKGGHRRWLTLEFPFDDSFGRRFEGGTTLHLAERKRTAAGQLSSETDVCSLA